MKKGLLLLLLAVIVLTLCACENAGTHQKGTAEKETDQIPVVIDQNEYLLYQNTFMNGYAKENVGKTAVKRGVLGKIHDAFHNMDRYYVWGYLDNTKCCDWQWEIVPKDPESLPAAGSLVSASGIFQQNDEALDKYWYTDVTVETEERYTGQQTDLNMLLLSDTLERVQVLNILYAPETFEGKAFTAYGRIAGTNMLEDPYYNGSWQIPFAAEDVAPAIGTMVKLQGRVKAGTLAESVIEIMP